jgi:hypothetical protein
MRFEIFDILVYNRIFLIFVQSKRYYYNLYYSVNYNLKTRQCLFQMNMKFEKLQSKLETSVKIQKLSASVFSLHKQKFLFLIKFRGYHAVAN